MSAVSTVSKGLRSVLGVDTGLISAKGGAQKISDADDAQDFIEKTVNQEILKSITWSSDSNYNEQNTYVFHDSKIYKSSGQSGNTNQNPSESNSTYWTLIATSDIDINKEMSKILSFDADMVRKEIIAWGLGRVAADYQFDIDWWESFWDIFTSGFDLGISAINTFSNIRSGSSTRRSLVKMGDSYVMMAQDAAQSSDNTNLLYKFVETKLKEAEKSFEKKPSSAILQCIKAISEAADDAMEEISDRTIDFNSAEHKILYPEIDTVTGGVEKKVQQVQDNIVDRVALFIANYYMINEFVFPKKDGSKYMGVKTESAKSSSEETILKPTGTASPKSGNGDKLSYITKKDGKRKLKNYYDEKHVYGFATEKEVDGLKPEEQLAREKLFLPAEVIDAEKASQSYKNLDNADIRLFLSVESVKSDQDGGGEVTVNIKLPEAVESSLSSSIVRTLNFTFTIPVEIYSKKVTLGNQRGDELNLNEAGQAAKQMFIDIAYNFVKAINPIVEANPIIGVWEILKNAIPDLMDTSKLGIEFTRSIQFHKNNTNKGEFERAADCYGAIPNVLEHSLAYIKSGHYFDDASSDAKFIKDI